MVGGGVIGMCASHCLAHMPEHKMADRQIKYEYSNVEIMSGIEETWSMLCTHGTPASWIHGGRVIFNT